jgi:hypothetical protein
MSTSWCIQFAYEKMARKVAHLDAELPPQRAAAYLTSHALTMSTPSPRTCPCTTAITPFRRTRPRFFVLSAAYSDFRAEIGRGRASLVRERVDRLAVSAISQSDVRLGIRVMGQRCALQVRCGGRVGPVGRARRLGAISKRHPPRAEMLVRKKLLRKDRASIPPRGRQCHRHGILFQA